MRTQSKDPIIQEAARRGVKLWRVHGQYFTDSVVGMARDAGVSTSTMRKAIRDRSGKPRADSRITTMNQLKGEITRLRRKLLDAGIDPDE